MLRVFVGSSTEAISSVAEPIASVLEQAGFKPLRWWQHFAAGEYTMESLGNTLAESDAGVFVCAADDKVHSRNRRAVVPRDNVVFELGYFIRQLGKKNCLIVKTPGVKLPTDLQGITYREIGADIDALRAEVVGHFAELAADRGRGVRERLHVGPSPNLTRADLRVTEPLMQSRLPETWNQRALYCGTEGARAWLAFATEYYHHVLSDADARSERTALLQAVDKLDVDSYVSFGPGDANTDHELVIALRARSPELKYIPVDISDGLIHHAFFRLSSKVQIPFGILTDFEQYMDFVEFSLHEVRRGTMLLSLLGGTFGNLDRYERTFLTEASDLLRAGDFLLFDVGVRNGDWVFSSDTTSNRFFASQHLRTFVSNGIGRLLGESGDAIASKFDERISVRPGRSDVPGAQCYEIFDRVSAKVGLRVRRYDWGELLAWITASCPAFEIVHERALRYEHSDLGSGIVLLRHR